MEDGGVYFGCRIFNFGFEGYGYPHDVLPIAIGMSKYAYVQMPFPFLRFAPNTMHLAKNMGIYGYVSKKISLARASSWLLRNERIIFNNILLRY